METLSALPFEKAKMDFDDGLFDSVWSENRRMKIQGSLNKGNRSKTPGDVGV